MAPIPHAHCAHGYAPQNSHRRPEATLLSTPEEFSFDLPDSGNLINQLHSGETASVTLSKPHYHGNVMVMSSIQSKVTAQGQISVPAEIRRKLGIVPGSILVWEEEDDRIIIRRSGSYSSENIHDALFPDGAPAPKSLEDLKEGIRKQIRRKRAGR